MNTDEEVGSGGFLPELIRWKGYECWSFAQPASTAARHYRLLRSKRGFAATSAHSARHVSITFFKTFVQTVAAGSSLVQSGHRKTGKVTTILVRTRQARSVGRDRLMSRNTRGSPQRSESFHLNSGKPTVKFRRVHSNILAIFSGGSASPGTRLLDLACGAGRLALIATRADARVIDCDRFREGIADLKFALRVYHITSNIRSHPVVPWNSTGPPAVRGWQNAHFHLCGTLRERST